MTYNVRFRAGFFKTQPYVLDISAGQILLYPRDDKSMESFVIKSHELERISISKGNTNSREIEIKTRTDTYIGILDSRTDFEQFLCDLSREFGRKFIINGGDS